MAGAFTAVDLSRLPAPTVVEQLDYETILSEMVADLQARDPAFSALVESDPAFKILEVAAFRELLIRQRTNEAALAVMLAFARGADLDQVAGNYNVKRLVIIPANPATIPPTVAVLEDDESLRLRVLLSLEGYTTAGSVGAYTFHALSASGEVKDVGVTSLVPGVVNVAILSRTGGGVPSSGVLATVVAALNAEVVRPLCDTVQVEAADVVPYAITASLDFYPGTGQAQVLAAAQSAAEQYAEEMNKLGRDITLSGIYAALHQPGVQKVNLTAPAADIVNQWNQAPRCTAVTVTVGVIDD